MLLSFANIRTEWKAVAAEPMQADALIHCLIHDFIH